VRGSAEHAAAWIYEGIWAALVRWFRVPEEPPALSAPPGESAESFRPAPGFLAYLKLLFWIALAAVDALLALVWLGITIAVPWLGALLFLPAVALIVAPDIVAYIAIHLRYDTTWYVMTSRSLRIRRGIWVIHEVTITFENVQNVSVSQGPVQRHFGISDVVVETAGAGAAQGQKGTPLISNRGVIEGVSDAARIRDLILARLRRSRTAGLGDERERPLDALAPGWTGEHLRVLREIRDEAAALRR